ncbi:hypothetical protein GCM10025865_22130 [Paraoerskovia sediminicola]|uniref:Energy transducer TonB n=1 Tax=Paraoerskovia sediminicola TaxID=1138587 RepID=A0ABN6XDG9_9CELL|nr:Rv3235 family protein [Paraoerskovia sediminicola]BDZ42914.1 hypothetical protein GCM10025865_22130 [Paraoerskovia sediminicola]
MRTTAPTRISASTGASHPTPTQSSRATSTQTQSPTETSTLESLSSISPTRGPVRQRALPAAHPGGETTPLRTRPTPAGPRGSRPASSPLGPPPLLEAADVRTGAARVARRPLAAPAAGGTVLTDPTATCCAVARTALEVLRGERPVGQLVRWLSPGTLEVLGRRARLTAASGPGVQHRPITVRRARTVRLGPAAAESTVVLEDGDRVRAAALRVEEHRGSWRVVALEIG